MRDVLGRVSTGAAGTILDSANPREKRRLCPLQRRRERTSSSVEIEGTCESKYFEETVGLQSEKRGERLHGIAEGASSAPRLASSSAVSFPGRNECPGTHCSLIEQEEREDRPC